MNPFSQTTNPHSPFWNLSMSLLQRFSAQLLITHCETTFIFNEMISFATTVFETGVTSRHTDVFRERKGFYSRSKMSIGRPIPPSFLSCSLTTWLPGLPLTFHGLILLLLLSTCGPADQSQAFLLRPSALIGREQGLRRVLLAYLAILSQ